LACTSLRIGDRAGSHRSEVIRGISKKNQRNEKFKENKKLQLFFHFFKNN
jgi:hypothetical protein